MAIRCRECGCEVSDEIYEVGMHEDGCSRGVYPWDNDEAGSVPMVSKKAAAQETQSLMFLLAAYVVADSAREPKGARIEWKREREALREEIGDSLSASLCSMLLLGKDAAAELLGRNGVQVIELIDRVTVIHPPPGWADRAEAMAAEIRRSARAPEV